MVSRIYDYWEYAENDRLYLEDMFKEGRVSNIICAATQNCIEKFFKHLIDKYCVTESLQDETMKVQILQTHSLARLMNFIKDNLDVQIDFADYKDIKMADGYYFSVRYPGPDSVMAQKEDIEICKTALDTAYKVARELKNELEDRIKKNYNEPGLTL